MCETCCAGSESDFLNSTYTGSLVFTFDVVMVTGVLRKSETNVDLVSLGRSSRMTRVGKRSCAMVAWPDAASNG